jgi:hypothetical protein
MGKRRRRRRSRRGSIGMRDKIEGRVVRSSADAPRLASEEDNKQGSSREKEEVAAETTARRSALAKGHCAS